MTTSRRGRGLLAVSAVSAAAVVLAMTAGGADAAQKPGGADAKKPAQADKQASGKERKGNYDARTPNAKTTYARTAKVQGKETAASKKFRDSLGTQGVVEVDQTPARRPRSPS